MSAEQEILILLVCLVLSGFFSGAEAALMSLPHEKAKQRADEHGLDSRVMRKWLETPNDILTTILVGNNFVNILLASMAASITERYFDNDALAISVGVTTVMILLFGEIMPKTVGRGRNSAL